MPQVDRRVHGSKGKPTSDRKSTRLNSSHLVISYAVFCLKKKKKTNVDNTINVNKNAFESNAITESSDMYKRHTKYINHVLKVSHVADSTARADVIAGLLL